ncbi:MAG: DUF5050 domain-containing protein [Clostridia bacterium]|nr:DUF5050 domain-containing protein [Clostridia bacterium]
MKKYSTQIVAIAISAILALTALFLVYKPDIKLPQSSTRELDRIKKDSAIVTDGEYVFYTNTDGNIIRMHAFDTEGKVFYENKTIMAMGETHFLAQTEEGFDLLSLEETGMERSYNIKTDNAEVMGDYIYYKHPETNHIMKINFKTGEESVALGMEVKKFSVYEDGFFFIPVGEKKGIVQVSFDGSTAKLYAQNITVTDFATKYYDLIYSDADNDNCVTYLNIVSGHTEVMQKVKSDKICFAKGVIFWKKSGGLGYDKLMINDENAYR